MSDRRYRGFGYHDQRRAADGIPPAAVIDLTSGYVVPIVVDLTGNAEDVPELGPSWLTRNASTGSPARNAPFGFAVPAASMAPAGISAGSSSVATTGPSARAASVSPTSFTIGSVSVSLTGPSALTAGAGSAARNAPFGFSDRSASVVPAAFSGRSASVATTGPSDSATSVSSTGFSIGSVSALTAGASVAATIFSDRSASADTTGPSARATVTGSPALNASVGPIDLSAGSASVDPTGSPARAAPNALQDSDKGIEAYSCPICLDRPQRPVATMCGHVFCHACFQRCLCESTKCPLCSDEVKELNYIKLYI